MMIFLRSHSKMSANVNNPLSWCHLYLLGSVMFYIPIGHVSGFLLCHPTYPVDHVAYPIYEDIEPKIVYHKLSSIEKIYEMARASQSRTRWFIFIFLEGPTLSWFFVYLVLQLLISSFSPSDSSLLLEPWFVSHFIRFCFCPLLEMKWPKAFSSNARQLNNAPCFKWTLFLLNGSFGCPFPPSG